MSWRRLIVHFAGVTIMPFDAQPVDEIGVALRVARGYIEQGWCTGFLRQANGQYCAIGAIRMAICGHTWTKPIYPPLYHETMRRLVDSLPPWYKEKYNNNFASVVSWNDAKGRTKQDVLAAFDRALLARKE